MSAPHAAAEDAYQVLLSEAAGHLHRANEAVDHAVAALGAAIALDPTPTPAAQIITWRVQRERRQYTQYFAESFQDRFIDECVLRGRRGGVFVDIGAYDGVTGSNTLFFEKFRGWSGLCIEPDAVRYAELINLRDAICLNVCVAEHEGEAAFLRVHHGFTQMGGMLATLAPSTVDYLAEKSITDTIRLPTRRLDSVLEANELFDIDYLSIDIEGAELAALRTLDFNRFHITCVSVERNQNESALRSLLRAAGFCRVRQLDGDDIYVNAHYLAAHAPHLILEMTGVAVAFYQQGELAQAEAAYRDILLADAQNPGIHYNFGLALLCQGKYVEAQTAFAQALELKPDFSQAQRMLEHLRGWKKGRK